MQDYSACCSLPVANVSRPVIREISLFVTVMEAHVVALSSHQILKQVVQISATALRRVL
jgi:hypothetical protein